MKKHVRVMFQDGREVGISLIGEVGSKAQDYLEEESGLIYGNGDLPAQTNGVLHAWMFTHSPTDPTLPLITVAAQLVMAKGIAAENNGYVGFTDDTGETVVYVPDKAGHYVVYMRYVVGNLVTSKETQEEFPVTTLKKDTLPSALAEQLRIAVEAENYELAAKLRDKMNKKRGKAE